METDDNPTSSGDQYDNESKDLINFRDVEFCYPSCAPILKSVNFSIRPRTFNFLTGLSGSGKTTLIRLMLGMVKPTFGSVRVFGYDTKSLNRNELVSIRHRIRPVFQDPFVLGELSVYENVFLPSSILGRREEIVRDDVFRALRLIGLDGNHEVKAKHLSAGEKQRVALAQTLVERPDLLIADEPTANVDPVSAQDILALFVELCKHGQAIIFCTHDVNLIGQVGNASQINIGDKSVFVYKASPTSGQ